MVSNSEIPAATQTPPAIALSKGQFSRLSTKQIKQEVDFMGEKVTIRKLSVSEVFDVQEASVRVQEDSNVKEALALTKTIIKLSAEGAAELTDEEFEGFPMGELTALSSKIMDFSGLTTAVTLGK